MKSAFHHIPVMEKHRKFLGYEVAMEGEARLFRFKAMPFGYKDASRILTKVMRTPICRWGSSRSYTLMTGWGSRTRRTRPGRPPGWSRRTWRSWA